MNRRTRRVAVLLCGQALAVVSCGGSDAPRPSGASGGNSAVGGSAGSSGSAGATAVGGNSGSSGGAGNSGAGGTAGVGGAAMNCVSGATKPPVAALITDFSDAVPDPANPGEIRFGGGDAARVQGGSSIFANPASTKGALSLSGGALSFAGTVSAPTASGADEFPFNGFVLQIDGTACIDASAYNSVSFTLSGDLGTCNLSFAFAYADDLASVSDSNRGLCSGTCYPSQFALTLASTSVSFTAAASVPGMPVGTVDKAKLLGVQWQLTPSGASSCTASFTIDDVKFQ